MVTVSCLPCHHLPPDSPSNYSLFCLSDGTWSRELTSCSTTEILCPSLNIDWDSVEEVEEISSASSCSNSTFYCRKQDEFFHFDFGLSNISYSCTPRLTFN